MDFCERILFLIDEYSKYVLPGLIVGIMCLAAWNIRLTFRFKRIENKTRKNKTCDLREMQSVQECITEIRKLDDVTTQLDEKTDLLQTVQKTAMQKVGLVRFDAFEDIGGEQSFALALLDAKSDGVVISSLFGRSESRVYAKSVNGGKSEHTLSSEEQVAVKKALGL